MTSVHNCTATISTSKMAKSNFAAHKKKANWDGRSLKQSTKVYSIIKNQ